MREWQNKFWSKDAIVRTVMLTDFGKGIKKVYFVNHIDGTPARCLRSTRECWVSLSHWNKLPFEHKVFILLHENAHIVLDTSDEKAVDAYAHKQYLKMGFSITESILALTKVLSYTNREHLERTQEQMIRAVVYDITKNNNTKLKDYLLNN